MIIWLSSNRIWDFIVSWLDCFMVLFIDYSRSRIPKFQDGTGCDEIENILIHGVTRRRHEDTQSLEFCFLFFFVMLRAFSVVLRANKS